MANENKEQAATPAAAPAPAPATMSPTKSPSPAPLVSSSPPRGEPIIAADDADDNFDDADSALGSDAASSTASVTASILEYRTIQGRTFHSDRHSTEYFTPNDDQQLQSQDITHHYLTVLLGDKLYLAPIPVDDVKKVLDVGTGSGIWAIDFADQHPQAEVIGSDLSPCQPSWVPPNVQFEVDDATEPWTWKDNDFDFIHIRYLFGAIADWNAIFKQAYRCCAPGGWVQSCEADVHFFCDDDTADDPQVAPYLKTWAKLYEAGGAETKRPFFVQQENLQEKGIEAAGFTDMKVVDYKLPVGGWPKDPKLAEVGRFVKLTMENDIEGYTLFMWHNVLKWPADEYQVFLMGMRKILANRKVHAYMMVRYVYARKPEA
ncbi:hypothetical protein NCS55_00018700 [Fusarium keratoplasticum]|nr:hypothetical protein NCS55_00018700 [Fusarium keratoplasticum]